MDPQSVRRRLTCILAADAVGYSQQMGQDEEGTIRVLSAHRAVIDGLIAFHGGRIMSTAGDSVLAEFASAVEAVRCAVEVQEALKTSNDALPEKSRMYFRVGVNLGDVVVKNDDLLGDGVNVAARLETIAEPGGICISSSVYDQITGKLDLGFQDIGEQSLKNISRPIRVYRVSGTGLPRPAPLAPTPRRARKPFPWGITAAVVVAIGGVAAWQTGWLRFGASERATPTIAASPAVVAAPAAGNAAPVVVPAPAPGVAAPANAPPPPARASASVDADTQRLRADAEAMKKQAEAVLAKARADIEAVRLAKAGSENEAAANRLRTQVEADAARIRSETESAAAARVKSEAEASARGADLRAANATRATASAAASGSSYDGTWSVVVFCAPTNEGAASYKIELDVQVKNNFLRGEKLSEGAPGWLRLQGPIAADGSATLDATGITDDPKYANKNVARGTPYGYHVATQFEARRAAGHRLELRACDLRFAKQ